MGITATATLGSFHTMPKFNSELYGWNGLQKKVSKWNFFSGKGIRDRCIHRWDLMGSSKTMTCWKMHCRHQRVTSDVLPCASQKALLLHLADQQTPCFCFRQKQTLPLFVYFNNYFSLYFTADLAYSDENLELNSNTRSFGPRLGQLFCQSHKETWSIRVTQKIMKCWQWEQNVFLTNLWH